MESSPRPPRVAKPVAKPKSASGGNLLDQIEASRRAADTDAADQPARDWADLRGILERFDSPASSDGEEAARLCEALGVKLPRLRDFATALKTVDGYMRRLADVTSLRDKRAALRERKEKIEAELRRAADKKLGGITDELGEIDEQLRLCADARQRATRLSRDNKPELFAPELEELATLLHVE